MAEPEYNLEALRVLHFEHPLQNNPEDASAAVLLGFEWAEAGEGQGLFLCRDTDRCKAPDICGKTIWDEANDKVRAKGHDVGVPLPWNGKDGKPVVLHVWCCPNCEIQGNGAVFDVWVGRFYDIPARLLAYHHEARSHTYVGLRKSLGKRYPDTFNEASFVTLVLYRRTV